MAVAHCGDRPGVSRWIGDGTGTARRRHSPGDIVARRRYRSRCASAERDVVFIDGDIGDCASLPLSTVGQLPPAPVIGLIGVTAPSRLKALMRAGATSFLRKPIHGFCGLSGAVRRRQRISPPSPSRSTAGRSRAPPPRPSRRGQGDHSGDVRRRARRRRSLRSVCAGVAWRRGRPWKSICSALVRAQDHGADDACSDLAMSP